MKYIQKGEEPQNFTEWKAREDDDWKPSWDNFQSPEKSNFHKELLQEQGFICCYCGMEIGKETSHIEHLKPRKTYPEEALNYNNLLVSCQRERVAKEPQHCGVKKDDWYNENLMVSPLDSSCADFFRYSGSGEILPNDEPGKQDAAVTTIDKLGLNISKLEDMRREAIDAIFLVTEGLTNEEIQELIYSRDANGKYIPFFGAIAYIFQQYFVDLP